MLTLLVILELGFSVLVHAILPIQIQNHRFIKATSVRNDPNENEVFFVKGIDYQPGGSSGFSSYGEEDLLSEPLQCARDVYAFQQLGINTVRIYQLNPDLNHDECMTMLNNAGIYVVLDVNSGSFGEHLNRADPKGSYNAYYLHRVFKFIESFKNYPNVLGFFSGNEVINDDQNYAEIDPPFLRALQRDIKQYISRHSNRTIPIGYSAADNTALRLATFKYLQCNSWDGENISKELEESSADFYGINSYQWCSGTSNWQSSGYQELQQTFKGTTIPLIFSEYGCNQNSPRTFDEVSEGLYDGLKDSFSGGLIYEFSEEANSYGLVYINNNDGSLTYKKDFENLAHQFRQLNLPNTKQVQLSGSNISQCDPAEIETIYKDFGTKDFWIPEQPDEITSMIEHGVTDVTPGSIIVDYKGPTTLEYQIKDVKGNPIDAKLTWDFANTNNQLEQKTNISNSTLQATSKFRPNSTIKNSGSLDKTTTVPPRSTDKIASPKELWTATLSEVTTSRLKKSKAEAPDLQVRAGGIIALIAVLLSII